MKLFCLSVFPYCSQIFLGPASSVTAVAKEKSKIRLAAINNVGIQKSQIANMGADELFGGRAITIKILMKSNSFVIK